MDFRILGPLAVERAGQDVPVPSAKVRTVLAYLLIQAGQAVSADALVDELWGEQPPASAVNTLQTYISQLRALLEPDRPPRDRSGLLRSVPGGYLLVAPVLDRARFEDAVQDGRAAHEAGEAGTAAELLRCGLSLWRGAALADVSGRRIAAEAARLDEQRLVALELRVEVDLALGRHHEIVGELDRLVGSHPWRERFVGQLMLALYRCGRQAEALMRYRTARDELARELGIEPGTELRALEAGILRQDPDLAAPPIPGQASGQYPSPGAVEPGVASGAPGAAGGAPAVAGGAPGAAGAAGGGTPVAGGGVPAPGRRRSARMAAAGAGLAVVTIAGVAAVRWPQADPVSAGAGSLQAAAVFNEYELAVRPGIGYDLDIPPGRPADWHVTNNPRSPDYEFLDLYRTSPKAAADQISGVDLRGTNEFNAVHLVADSDPPSVCGRLPDHGGGNVHLSALRAGGRVCLRTNDRRWAMITVTRMPASRSAVLFAHVTVLVA